VNLSNKLKTATLLLFLSSSLNAAPRKVNLDNGNYSMFGGTGTSSEHAFIEVGFGANKRFNRNYGWNVSFYCVAEGTNEEHTINFNLERRITDNYSLVTGFGIGEQLVLRENLPQAVADTTRTAKQKFPGHYTKLILKGKASDRISIFGAYKENHFNKKGTYIEKGNKKYYLGIEYKL